MDSAWPDAYAALVKRPIPSLVSLRRTILSRVGLLVTGTALLVGAGFVLFGLVPMTERIAQTQFNVATARVDASLDAMFAPAAHMLDMSRGWLDGKVPDLDDPAGFNRIFQPVLGASPQITSVVAGTSSGQGWLLLQQPGGAWRNRMTDIERWGNQRHLFIDRDAQGRETREFRTVEYDPRKRPWYGASQTVPGTIHWTSPYTFFTTGDPGITVSTRMRLADGRDFVIGFDLMLRDLSLSTMTANVSAGGLALVTTEDARVLALPALPAGVNRDEWAKRILQPADKLGIKAVDEALHKWRRAERASTAVMSYYADGTRWLSSVRPYALGNQRLWVVTLAPAADFAPPWRDLALALVGGLLLVVVLAMVIVRQDARRIATPLEQLADASKRIGDLDFSPVAKVQSGIAEVHQLAQAQEEMRGLLQRNQDTLARQTALLNDQIRALTEAEMRIRESEAYNKVLFADSRIPLVVLDPATRRLVDCNQAAVDIFHLPDRATLLGSPPESLSPARQYDGRTSLEAAEEHVELALRTGSHVFEWRSLRADGSVWDAEVHMMPFKHGDRALLQFSLQDITQRKAAAGEIEQLAFYDTLTQLPNRRLLTDRLHQAVAASRRSRQHGALLFIDLDNFKTLNDTLGHDKGDLLLQQVAQRLIASVREVDTVGRFGGDEFLVMLEQLSADAAEAATQTELVAEKIVAALNRPYQLTGREFHSTPSIGIALFAAEDDTADELLKRADVAMYQAKAAGRNAIRFYDPRIQALVNWRAALEDDLRRAVRDSQLELHYQLQVDRTGQPVGVEALLRWHHPVRGLVYPNDFIPLAEETGQILALGEWVLETACNQLVAWAGDAATAHLMMAVNVSGRQLRDANFVAQVLTTLDRCGARPERLKLEITESLLLEDMQGTIAKMTALRAHGISFALDDFGTGFSSLGYLKQLPLEQLKIDQSFVRDILTDSSDASIAGTIITLAHSLGLNVIAEGVETEAQRDFLASHGCHTYQGYLFGKPVSAGELDLRLRS